MKRIISDKELLSYVNGRMTTADIQMLHKKAIDNSETDLLLHVILSNYESQKDYATELLGEDDFKMEECGEIIPMRNIGEKADFRFAADVVNRKKNSEKNKK